LPDPLEQLPAPSARIESIEINLRITARRFMCRPPA